MLLGLLVVGLLGVLNLALLVTLLLRVLALDEFITQISQELP